MHNFRHLLLSAFYLLCCTTAGAKTLIVHHYPFVNAQELYMQGLLELALSYSEKSITFRENSSRSFTNTAHRGLVEAVKSNEISLMWSGTSSELERELLPVRIPLYKGLLGHRLLLINQGAEEAFAHISDQESLSTIRFGQGDTWPDTKVLKNANLMVVTSPSYTALFKMLVENQFDAFPRGLQEPWAEISAQSDKALTVERDILLVYKLPSYFFVSRENSELAREIELGLEAAIADLNFDDYFFYSRQVADAIEQAQAVGRVVLELENPFLPQETPLERKELWLDISDL